MICFVFAGYERLGIANDLHNIHAFDKDLLPTAPSDLKESISNFEPLVNFSYVGNSKTLPIPPFKKSFTPTFEYHFSLMYLWVFSMHH